MTASTERKRNRWRERLAETSAEVHRLRDVERQRAVLFVEGRNLDPPATFNEMAEIAGVTPAAVKQVVKREEGRTA